MSGQVNREGVVSGPYIFLLKAFHELQFVIKVKMRLTISLCFQAAYCIALAKTIRLWKTNFWCHAVLGFFHPCMGLHRWITRLK